MTYPDDANGDVLRRMEEGGDDLTRPRDIKFALAFPDENTARQFAHRVCMLGFAASPELTGTDEDFPWDVIAHKAHDPLTWRDWGLRGLATAHR